MWISYEEKRNHPPDFRVRYRFLTIDEGGRNELPYQGYRSDFAIEADFNRSFIDLRIIHPEFEEENGKLILEETIKIHNSGTARMWILFPKSRVRHRNELVIGMKGYFMEGNKKVAEAEIIEIIGLHTNPSIE
ncbi:hypothetical protein [Paenibacillus macquariensis]|uniref:Uncharacterized protein n=1 Tax=Paenibacillus macquariensis TaxID=948756 RepID=A0ABY1KDY3_9BACL|nr:hypothetical protein [Paenibacillus macquariensis]MEC0093157.1 hypothetical protein [Paenibacillus macquariensis]OAB29922.1 hypothetical protein PMSM_23590 [Paenibacillus macquariensis subsp. macquariensis]SIR68414.1 hypothetical protein SAMN05421578_1332 [Paenibacillus macquariensis]